MRVERQISSNKRFSGYCKSVVCTERIMGLKMDYSGIMYCESTLSQALNTLGLPSAQPVHLNSVRSLSESLSNPLTIPSISL